jgi:hypothetical protein
VQHQRSLEIQPRPIAALRLLRNGQFSTPMLAHKLGVSIPRLRVAAKLLDVATS